MRKFIGAICIVAVLLSVQQARAVCNWPQPRLVCAEFYASGAVVKATLIKSRAIHDKDDPYGILAHVYTLKVSEVLRGELSGTVEVYDGNDSGRVTFDWVRGRTYLLFLDYVREEHVWAVDSCGNSGPVMAAESTLSKIATLKSAHGDGVIHGAVSHESLSDPFRGVRVLAIGIHQTYEAVSDDKGEFRMKVPSGLYRLQAISSGLNFKGDFLSYEDPEKIQIQPGSCAQVQIVGKEVPH